jgi:hypothetical protein
MPKGDKTKKIRGTDLSAKHFLYIGCPHPNFWLLPVCDPTSKEKTKRLIERGLDCWEQIKRHIPLQEHRSLRAQLEGAALSHGIHVPEPVTVTDDEMVLMLGERAATRVLAEIDAVYD